MSPENDRAPKDAKAWIDLVVPLLTGSSAVAGVVFNAVPLAPTLRATALLITLPAAFLAFLGTRRALRRRSYGFFVAGVWLLVTVIALFLYRWFLAYATEHPTSTSSGSVVYDLIQCSIYATVFAAATIALSIALHAWIRPAA